MIRGHWPVRCRRGAWSWRTVCRCWRRRRARRQHTATWQRTSVDDDPWRAPVDDHVTIHGEHVLIERSTDADVSFNCEDDDDPGGREAKHVRQPAEHGADDCNDVTVSPLSSVIWPTDQQPSVTDRQPASAEQWRYDSTTTTVITRITATPDKLNGLSKAVELQCHHKVMNGNGMQCSRHRNDRSWAEVGSRSRQ